MQMQIKKTIQNLEKNNICAHYLESSKEIIPLIDSLVEENATVAVGGSVTLAETGVLAHLRSGRFHFLDRYKEGLTREEVTEIFKQSIGADAYFCSCNAVTEEGELYNVDGNANRVAAIAFGPKKVIMIVGINKIVSDMDEAVKRVKTVAAPKNCVRLNCQTYCREKGHCVDPDGGMGKGCDSDARICRHYLVSSKQSTKGRMHVLIVNENLGY